MVAHKANMANVGQHGIPMNVATDPANQFRFVVADPPVTDWAAKALDKAQDAFYDKHYTSKKQPVKTAGDLWSVKLKE
jgi:hypothetical protein